MSDIDYDLETMKLTRGGYSPFAYWRSQILSAHSHLQLQSGFAQKFFISLEFCS